jgi:hypothetical protein
MTEYTGFESNGYDRDVSSDFEFFEYSAPRNAHDSVLKEKEHIEQLLKMIQI